MYLVLDSHDLSLTIRRESPSNDFEFIRQRVRLNYQTVIASSRCWCGDTSEDGFANMVDLVYFAVHQSVGTNDLTASRRTDGLVAETNA